MKLRSTQLFLMLLGLIILLSACANAKTTAPEHSVGTTKKTVYVGSLDAEYFDNIDEVYKGANFVIRGKVVGSRVEWMSHKMKPTANDPKTLTTIFTVEIVSFYKGDTGTKTIEVMQMGGETEIAIYRYEDQPEITKNTEYIMFLSKNPVIDNAAWLIAGGMQSLYRIDGNRLVSSPDNKLALNGFKEKNHGYGGKHGRMRRRV